MPVSHSRLHLVSVGLLVLILLVGLFPIGPLATLIPAAQAATPTFASIGTFGVSNSDATDIQFGDFDSDGDMDAVVAACSNSAVYMNDGSGSFSAPGSRRSLGSACHQHLAIGDVDRDGDLDLVTANQTAGQVQIHGNNGNGQFTIRNAAASGTIPIGIVALADLNGDARLDLVVATASATNSYLAQASGTFTATSSVSPALSGATAIALGDMDSDGDVDLVTVSGTTGRVYENNGGFAAAAVATFGGNIPLNGVSLGDTDGNGTLDIVVGRSDQTGVSGSIAGHPVLVFQNDGSDTFFDGSLDCANPPSNAACVLGPVTFLSTAPTLPSLGDIDDDGDLDLVVIHGPSGEIARVYFNDGSGDFNTITPAGFAPRYLELVKAGLADLDGDYDLDFVALSPEQPSTVYRNSGSGRLSAGTLYSHMAALSNPSPPAIWTATATLIWSSSWRLLPTGFG
ncbi:MAG: VCBS repeat-containing protein [Oscillochloris sp.]|nr:VCBS repeat-containing protein [Oscillochloris sp.]